MLAPPPPATWHIALPRGATAVPIARAMVRTALQDLRVAADRTTAQLLTAELVTNALKHARGTEPIELVVKLHPTGCLIEVHDDDPLLIDVLLDDPFPLSELGDAVLVAAPDAAGPAWAAAGRAIPEGAPSGEGAPPVGKGAAADTADRGPAADGARTADGTPTAEGTRRAVGRRTDGPGAADDRLPAQRTEGAGLADDADESTETGGTVASTSTRPTASRPPGTPIIHATDAAEAADAVHAAETTGHPHGHDDHRRGLLLLRSLSSDAGCRRTPRGKAVWFTLPEVPRRRR